MIETGVWAKGLTAGQSASPILLAWSGGTIDIGRRSPPFPGTPPDQSIHAHPLTSRLLSSGTGVSISRKTYFFHFLLFHP